MAAAGVDHQVIHTGQHYEDAMSQVFFSELGIGAPAVNLAIGSGGHGHQTGAMMAGLEDVFMADRPDWVLVYGDTNSTLAATLAAVKLHIPVAHLESGLRSFNRSMPEEHNRVLTDHAADLLLTPTQGAVDQLTKEGLGARAVLVGDVMTDVLLATRDAVLAAGAAHHQGYYLATIHRAENVDHDSRLRQIVKELAALPVPVHLPVHPRLRDRARHLDLALDVGAIMVQTPLSYREMVAAVIGSEGVITDSGGLQKEAYLLGRPCTTLRTETEWVETLDGGWNQLVADPAKLANAVLRPPPTIKRLAPYGDGHAAERVVQVLLDTRHAN
jgi:UDP-N-acetylglucosamine 2-epimerase (non-hydrolysing)